jgi:nucleoside-diphosphate-sugar epimerase
VRALVTGASGFIGRHLVRALLAEGHEVRCLLRASSSRDGLDGAEPIIGDIVDPGSLGPAVAGVDRVFHLASLLKMPWKKAFFSVNAEGTANLAKAIADSANPATLVVVSSLAAAGPSPSDAPRDESTVPAPVSIYGRVKLAAERAAAEHAGRAPIVIVRPPMVFGEGDRSVLKIYQTTRRGFHLVPTWRAHRVSLIHATDLSTALIRAGGADPLDEASARSLTGRGIYYAAADERPSYGELGALIAAGAGARRPTLLRLPSAITWLAALGSELVARVRDRPAFLNLDKWTEATAGSWICLPEKLKALGWRHDPLSARLTATAEWYRREGWLP